MTWTKLHDGVPNHPKLIRAGAEAAWLWAAGLCYSNAHHLDGKLDKDLIPSLYTPLARKAKSLAAKLCLVRLWHDCGDHYEIHDYKDYQEQALKEAVEARREYERERKAEQRSKHKQSSHGGGFDDGRPNVPDNVRDKPNGTSSGVPPVARAIPDPSRPAQARTDPMPFSVSTGVVGQSPLEEAEADSFARRVAVRFTELFEDRYRDAPSMGGKNVGAFAGRLSKTAKLRRADPIALLELAFSRWAAQPRDEIAKRAPYAAFIARFGELLDQESTQTSERERLLEQQTEALKAGNRELYAQLVSEYRERFGGDSNGTQPSV
jgi:hypothetical protein